MSCRISDLTMKNTDKANKNLAVTKNTILIKSIHSMKKMEIGFLFG